MAIIPNGQKFRTMSSSLDTTQKGSKLINKNVDTFTMDDIVETVNFDSGGGSEQNIEQVLTQGNDANGLQLKGVADPTEAQDVVTKSYLESVPSNLPYSSTIMKVTQSGNGTPNVSFLLNEIGISFVSIFKSTGQISLNMTSGTYPSDENTMFIVGDFHNGFYGAQGLAAGVHNGQTLYVRTYGVDNAGALQLTDLGFGGTESIIIELRDFS